MGSPTWLTKTLLTLGSAATWYAARAGGADEKTEKNKLILDEQNQLIK